MGWFNHQLVKVVDGFHCPRHAMVRNMRFFEGDAPPEDADRRAPSGHTMTGDWLGGCWAFPNGFDMVLTFYNLCRFVCFMGGYMSWGGTIEFLGNRFPVCFF